MTRNRIKRAIRENFKIHKEDIIARDIIVIARQPAKDMTTLEIQGSLEHVLKLLRSLIKRLNRRVGILDPVSLRLDKPKSYIMSDKSTY